MIHVITGIPGSGKTCLALKIFTDEFYHYDKKNDQFYMKKEHEGLTLITNIDGLKLPHISLDKAISDSNMTYETFFTVDFQKRISSKYKRIIYIIDECQRYFSKALKNRDTIFYFDYHRHLGHDIYLITQDVIKIHREILAHHEFEYRLTKKAFSVAGEFRYLIKSSGDIMDRKTFRPPKHIFRLYKSFQAPTSIKTKNQFRKYIIVPLIITLIAGYFLFNRVTEKSAHAKSQQAKLTNKSNEKTSFKNEKPKTDGELSHSTRIEYIPIENKVEIGDKLRWFVCPITGELMKPEQSKYPVMNKNGIWVMQITQKRWFQIKQNWEFYHPSGDKPNEPALLTRDESEHEPKPEKQQLLNAFFNKQT